MTRFIDTRDLARLIETIGLARLLQQLAQCIEDDFKRWPMFDKAPRLASHSKIGVIELMPASDGRLYGFKYVNGHPSNGLKGLPTVMAFGALATVDTGYPLLLSELTLATALRTAATSAMAARALARPGSRCMALIGCGAQAEFQSLAFHHLLGIDQLRIFDIDENAMNKLRRNLGDTPGLDIVTCADTCQAVSGADIVTTVTADKAYATILTPDMLEPGMHLNALGGDCPGKTELHAEVLRQARIFVEYEPQTRIEGDIQQLPPDHPVTELWKVLTGAEPGRRKDDEITVFDSVGFAIEDFSTLCLIHDLAERLGLGQHIQLVPELEDPKNLFSLSRNRQRTAAA